MTPRRATRLHLRAQTCERKSSQRGGHPLAEEWPALDGLLSTADASMQAALSSCIKATSTLPFPPGRCKAPLRSSQAQSSRFRDGAAVLGELAEVGLFFEPSSKEQFRLESQSQRGTVYQLRSMKRNHRLGRGGRLSERRLPLRDAGTAFAPKNFSWRTAASCESPARARQLLPTHYANTVAHTHTTTVI